ncbi:MAG TPA: isoaspartyl peptidase/L-asparaginase, partial [Verrucomicrobiaceae bacterium]
MKICYILATIICCRFIAMAEAPITLVIHGGAGVSPKDLTPDKEKACRATLEESLRAGYKLLQAGGSSADAVQTAIMVLEDSPFFNAGRGAVLTSAGTVEMDASIMEGATGKAGAVATVQGVKNPIRLARLVMEKTPHVFLTGHGAEEFAREQKLDFEPPEYFITPEQVEKLEKAKKKAAQTSALKSDDDFSLRIGTVGAVALDRAGHLTAGTSTGGLTNKRPGRAGDSPVIGAGTYAEDGVCAVSCTGHGEFFIRAVVAHEIASLVKYRGLSATEAARQVIHEKL